MLGQFDFNVIERSIGYLFREGMTFTLTLTALAVTGGIVFGTLLAMMRLSSFKALSAVAGAYVNLMRSVPLVLVIFWFYFLVPYIGAWIVRSPQPIQVGAFYSSVVTFTLFEAAYYCEIMRAGIQSVSRGQVSAGYALGLNYWQTMGRIAPLAVVLLAGCSTHPIADFLDVVKPAPQLNPHAAPAAPCLPTYPAGPPATTPAPGPAVPAPPPPNWPGA